MFSMAAALVLVSTVAGAQGTVKCKDGTGSKGGQGACSVHGGIAVAAAKTPAKADAKVAKVDAKADAKMAKIDAKADAKMAKADAKADAKAAKADVKADAKVAKMDAKADTKAEAKVAKGKGAATATCTDGTKSYSESRAGACSGHGGVKKWMSGAPKS